MQSLVIKSDDQLWSSLDDPHTWIVRGDAGRTLVRAVTLRHALHQALGVLSAGILPATIIRSEDQVVIAGDQMYRLWERAGLLRRPRLRRAGRPIDAVRS
jgi:hypothetical protein